MKQLVIIAALIGLTGCFEQAGKKVAESLDVPAPKAWALSSGKSVNIGGETAEIIGTDNCSTGFGDTYSCWRFSLTPGDTQLVILSNGIQELWTTEDAGEGRVYLVRPNGFKVVAE
jgi:hypothetical protein